jgi:hypothetical protein
LRFDRDTSGGIKPYVRVRGDLWARITRALTYDLIELGEDRQSEGAKMFGVAAEGRFYPIAPASDPADLS